MRHFLDTVLQLEMNLESGSIRTGSDSRHDIFDPSDDQSAIAFILLCGSPSGQYPGRGNNGTPQGGMVSAESPIIVQPKWQKALLASRHAMYPKSIRLTEHGRKYYSNCSKTSGVEISYALLPPKYFQTGHRDWKKLKLDAMLRNLTVMYHPNFIRGSSKKIDALKS